MNSLKELHWLPVEYHVKYKILTIPHKRIYGNAPAYLKNKVTLVDCNNRYSLRSNDDSQKLVVLKTKCVTYGDRSFSFNAFKYWNMLPHECWEQSSLNMFKKQLKHIYSRRHIVVNNSWCLYKGSPNCNSQKIYEVPCREMFLIWFYHNNLFNFLYILHLF